MSKIKHKIATELVQGGRSVIPLIKDDKKPAISWKKYQKEIATPEDLKNWFIDNNYDIGIVTGEISGITVIDIDSKDGKDGYSTLAELGIRKTMPTSLIRHTPNNGTHIYIKYNPKFQQSQGREDIPLIDIRNDGGYVKFYPLSVEDRTLKRHVFQTNDSVRLSHDNALEYYDDPIFHARGIVGDSPYVVGVADVQSTSVTPAPAPNKIQQGSRHDFLLKETLHYMRTLPTDHEILKAVTNSFKANVETLEDFSDHEIKSQILDIIGRYKFDLNIRSITDIESKETEWLWHPYIPKNMVTLIAGMPSSMKSYFVIDLALRLSLKLQFADGNYPSKNHNVLYFPVEDSLEHTIRTRIEKQNKGVPTNLFVSDKTLNLTKFEAQQEFKQQLINKKIDVVILDPISSFLGGKDTNSESTVRPVLEFLKSLEAIKVTTLLIRHTNKGEAQNNFDKVAGSGAWVQVVRSLLLVAKSKDEKNKSLIKLEKNNLVADSEYMLELINNDGVINLTQIAVDETVFNENFNNKDADSRSVMDMAMECTLDYLAENIQAEKVDIERYSNARADVHPRSITRAIQDLQEKNLIIKKKGTGDNSRKVFYLLSDNPVDQKTETEINGQLRSSGSSETLIKESFEESDLFKSIEKDIEL